MRPIVRRALAAVLAGLALAAPCPSAAQRRDPAEAEALLLFITSLAAQKTARFCERAMPEYRQRFDEVYGRWAARHTSRIARGERVFREARAEKDRPYTDHAQLEQIEKAMIELAQPPVDTSPVPLNERVTRLCDMIIEELETQLKQQP